MCTFGCDGLDDGCDGLADERLCFSLSFLKAFTTALVSTLITALAILAGAFILKPEAVRREEGEDQETAHLSLIEVSSTAETSLHYRRVRRLPEFGVAFRTPIIASSYDQPSTVSAEKVIIDSLRVSRLNFREVSGGKVPGPMRREFMGSRDWVGRVGGWWQV